TYSREILIGVSFISVVSIGVYLYRHGVFFHKPELPEEEPVAEVVLGDGRLVKIHPVTPPTSPRYLGPVNPFEVYKAVAPNTNLGSFQVGISFDRFYERTFESTGGVRRLSSRAYDYRYYKEVISLLDKQLLEAGY